MRKKAPAHPHARPDKPAVTERVVFMEAPLAVSIEDAAHMVGIARTTFYEAYINTGRVKLVPCGSRRLVDVEELRGAYRAWVAEARGNSAHVDPEIVTRPLDDVANR